MGVGTTSMMLSSAPSSPLSSSGELDGANPEAPAPAISVSCRLRGLRPRRGSEKIDGRGCGDECVERERGCRIKFAMINVGRGPWEETNASNVGGVFF